MGEFKRCLYACLLYFSFIFLQATLRLEQPFEIAPSWAKVTRLSCPSNHIISHLMGADLKKAWPEQGHSPPEAVPKGDS